jgi:hypothetical protein
MEAFFVIDQNRSSANWPLAKTLQRHGDAETEFKPKPAVGKYCTPKTIEWWDFMFFCQMPLPRATEAHRAAHGTALEETGRG